MRRRAALAETVEIDLTVEGTPPTGAYLAYPLGERTKKAWVPRSQVVAFEPIGKIRPGADPGDCLADWRFVMPLWLAREKGWI